MPSYTETDSPSIFYLDYGAHTLTMDFQTDLNTLLESSPALSNGGQCYAVRSVKAAYIEGYRAAFSAVSREGPRLGLLNLEPVLTPQPYGLDGAASPVQSATEEAEAREARLADVNPRGRVYGVLYELPQACEAAVLELVGREGSFNRYATLPCTVVEVPEDVGEGGITEHPLAPAGGDVGHGSGGALVCAALDMDLLVTCYVVPDSVKASWRPMPPVLEAAEEKAADPRTCGSGRWPYMHWCNCIASNRLAPAPEYLSSLREMLKESPVALCLPPGIESVEALLADYYGLASTKAEPNGSTAFPIPSRNVAVDLAEQRTWYLAYGSNLSWEQVCLRIGPPYDRRPVKLHGYELVPNKTSSRAQYASFGYYNVEPCEVRREKEAKAVAEGNTHARTATTMPGYVCGAAYEISVAQLAMMDLYEHGYDRERLPCEDISPSAEERLPDMACWTYIADGTSEEVLPSKEYLTRVLEGADILPPEYIEGIRNTPTNPQRSPRQNSRLRKEL